MQKPNRLPVLSRQHGFQRIHTNARLCAGPRLPLALPATTRLWPDADVWDGRCHWHSDRIRLEAELRCGRFCFGPLSVATKADGEVLRLRRARDG